MFFLGHMVWAYVLAKPFSRDATNIYLLMLLAILPDVDILLNSTIEHRSITHSMIFITLASIPFFIRYKRAFIPYFIAVSQHVLFGDLIVGKTEILWPFDLKIGLGLRLTSLENMIIEGLGLAIFIAMLIKEKRLFASNLSALIPLMPLLVFIIIFITDNIDELLNLKERDEIAYLIAFLHIILISILIVNVSNGIIKQITRLSKFREK